MVWSVGRRGTHSASAIPSLFTRVYTDGRPRPVRFLLLRSPRPNHVLRSAPNNFWPNPPRSCTAAATAAAAVRVCNPHGKWFSMAGQRQLPPEPFANPFQRDRGPPSRRPRAKPRLHRFRQSFSNQMTPAAVLSDVSQETRSVKDKPFYCQSSVSRACLSTAAVLSAATFEPHGNGDERMPSPIIDKIIDKCQCQSHLREEEEKERRRRGREEERTLRDEHLTTPT